MFIRCRERHADMSAMMPPRLFAMRLMPPCDADDDILMPPCPRERILPSSFTMPPMPDDDLLYATLIA